MTDSLLTATFTPCGKVRKTRDRNDDSFIFLCIDGEYVPFRANSPQLDNHVGEDMFVIADEASQSTELSLIGFRVIDTEQGDLGIITAVDNSTANMLIELDNGTLLPLHEDFILSLDDNTLTLKLPFRL